ncbi:MAG: GtrA family protein [Verrucomicrobia bacterium]|nr:GtrA family protein [Verrucomicrobiota bacterium]
MKKILIQFTRREAHPVIQFIKYGLAGGAATFVDVVLFFLFAWKVFPALTQDEMIVRLFHLNVALVDEAIRSRNYLIIKVIVFIFSNFTAYVLNVLWVFHPGKHDRKTEIMLFYVVSTVSYAIGTAIGWGLIQFAHQSTSVAYVINLVAAVLINYAGRKFLVFKG